MAGQTNHCCATCARGFICANGKICCGAAFEDNPIWAQRKYGEQRIAALVAGNVAEAAEPIGADCANMDSADGAECVAWVRLGG